MHRRVTVVASTRFSFSYLNILSRQASNLYRHHKTMADPAPATSVPLPNTFSRFQLPGLNLPLNWEPYGPDSKWDGTKMVQCTASGEGRSLFRTALNDHDVMEGYAAYVSWLIRPNFSQVVADLLIMQPSSNSLERVHNATYNGCVDR
jgi:hypothetical protein